MTDFSALGIDWRFPETSGIFDYGALAALGLFLNYFFGLLIVIWVAFSIYAGYKIVLSQGNEKDMEKGFTLIKNVWISVTWGVLFFVAVSIIGSFAGVGNITQWYYNFAQCKDASGGFFFLDRSAQQFVGAPTEHFYCCKVSGSIRSAAKPYNELDFAKDTYHFVGTQTKNAPGGIFTECELFY